MAESRRDLLLRFAAGAFAAACGGRASFAADRPSTPPPLPDPMPMPVYGPPPPRVMPLPNCGDRCGSDGKTGADKDRKPDDGDRAAKSGG